MNTYALIIFLFVFNISIGSLIAFQTSNEAGYLYLTTRQYDADAQNTKIMSDFKDTYSSSNDQNADKRTGNENTITLDFMQVLKGLHDLWGLVGTSQIQWVLIRFIQLFYAGVTFAVGLVLFDKWKNRKVD